MKASQKTILVVEDEPLILIDVADTLSEAGYRVIEPGRPTEPPEQRWACQLGFPKYSSSAGRAKSRGILCMANGTVKFFNTDKGFGFIKPDIGGDDVFVHVSEVQRAGIRTLIEGDKITYELAPGRNGRLAASELAVSH
jgi:CspA family cold shock protein